MITCKKFEPAFSYFAAANTHNGFHSEFDTVFAPEAFDKIYIFKGGPGTGKSSIMKGVAAHLYEKGIPLHAIYCSSDPKSLDGIVADSPNGRIALIDGTAPHITDPAYPGAVEQIINLGDGFNIAALREKREAVIALNKTKKNAYIEAYSTLCIAGKIFDYIWAKIKESSLYNEAELITSRILKSVKASSSVARTNKIYTASFSKYGYLRLPLEGCERQVISIRGERYFVYLVMNLLYQRLKEKSVISILAPSPLDFRMIDRIYTSGTAIVANEDTDTAVDLTDYKCNNIDNLTELNEMYDNLLSMSAKHFGEASDAHFKIEDIYVGCMDFSRNDRIYSDLLKEL